MDIQTLENLERAGKLRGRPALTKQLQALRLEKAAADELRDIEAESKEAAAKPPARSDLPLPTEAQGVGLLARRSLLRDLHLPAVPHPETGELISYHVVHSLQFIPTWYYKAILASGSWMDPHRGGQSAYVQTFALEALKGDLYELILKTFNPHVGGDMADSRVVNLIFHDVIGETKDVQRLTVWCRAAVSDAVRRAIQRRLSSLRVRND